jgi:predicted dehydrogenase
MVGAGHVAQAYAQAFANYRVANLVAIADIRPELARDMAEGLKCRSFDSYERMAEECDLDAVIVCTPPVTHPEVCTYFLRRGVHVLCEKPLSIDVASAKQMLETARQNGVLLTMASKFRHVDDVIRAKSLITSGMIGDVILFENAFASRVDMSSRWNSVPEISGGGVLIDNGTHAVDLMRYFLGPLVEIHALEGRRSQNLLVEDSVHILVRSASQVVACSDLSWSLNKERETYIEIYGTEGVISIGWQGSKYRTLSAPEWVKFGNGYNKVEAFRSQVENFTKAVLGEQHALVTSEDALASVQIIAAAYAALREKRWATVATNGNGHDLSTVTVESVA